MSAVIFVALAACGRHAARSSHVVPLEEVEACHEQSGDGVNHSNHVSDDVSDALPEGCDLLSVLRDLIDGNGLLSGGVYYAGIIPMRAAAIFFINILEPPEKLLLESMQVVPVLLKTHVTAPEEGFVHVIELCYRREEGEVARLMELMELLEIVSVIVFLVTVHEVGYVLRPQLVIGEERVNAVRRPASLRRITVDVVVGFPPTSCNLVSRRYVEQRLCPEYGRIGDDHRSKQPKAKRNE